MKRLLITGSNGLIGKSLVHALSESNLFDFLATSRNSCRGLPESQEKFHPLDVTHPDEVTSVFREYQPDAVIHTAAMASPNECEENSRECDEINVEGTRNILDACRKQQTHLIHLSSDFVFDGKHGPYRETDAPHPLSQYGHSKLQSEQLVSAANIPWTIVRTCMAYGVAPALSRDNLVTWVVKSLRDGKAIRVVSDQYRTPTLVDDLAQGCLKIAESQETGVFHLSGEEMYSVFDFANLVALAFNLDAGLISPVATADLHEKARRPLKTGFIIEKAQNKFGFVPCSNLDGLKRVHEQMDRLKTP